MIKRVICLVVFWFVASSTQAELRLIPMPKQLDPIYFSTSLLLDPCLTVFNVEENFGGLDKELRREIANAQRFYPTGTCDNPQLAKKLFQVRFLQHSLLEDMPQPWNFAAQLAEQDQQLRQCKDTECLAQQLNQIIRELWPIYANLQSVPSQPAQESQFDLAHAMTSLEQIDHPKKARAIANLLQKLDTIKNCGAALEDENQSMDKKRPRPAEIAFNLFPGEERDLLLVQCGWNGVVNWPEWVYLLQKNGELKALTGINYDGPIEFLPSQCNGLPDLMTTARYNMAEHLITYYRYDGRRYRKVLSYMDESIGKGNKNPYSVATLIDFQPLTCR